MKGNALPDAQRRILRYLSLGEAVVDSSACGKQLVLKRGERAAIAAAAADIDVLEGLGFVRRRQGRCILLLPKGRTLLKEMERAADRFRARHQDIEHASIQDERGDWTRVVVNHAESPLAGLVRRRTRAGEPFLSRLEYEAGERLRADYDRGCFMARTGVNWDAAGSGSAKRRIGNQQAELTDVALAARERVDKAIDSVGPELAGLLIDICCFLKGLERVERERGWPVRSAKIVLKNALAALARHYSPQAAGHGGGRRTILHWGGEGYRPSL